MAFSESESTDRLVCDDDLDKPAEGAAAGNPQFGAFMGQGQFVDESDSSIPTIALGLSDLSIELVISLRTGDQSVGEPDLFWICGLTTNDGSGTGTNSADPMAGVYPVLTIFPHLRFRWGGPSVATVDLLSFNPRPGWTHLCVTYDRNGDMEVFDNGVSAGSASISADSGFSIPEQGIYPMVSETDGDGSNDELADDPSGLILPWATPIGGFALHSRVLTGPEITANAAALDVGDYPETEARYNFDSFVDGAGAAVTPTQETTLGNIQVFNKWTLPSPQDTELFVPEGANGTVQIEDLSDSGRHFGLQTQASYGSGTLAARGRVGFATTGAAP